MNKVNYWEVFVDKQQTSSFHYKHNAITFARKKAKAGKEVYIKSKRTEKVSYVLEPDQTSCSVCGNELEGKQSCPLCGQPHIY